MRNDQLLRLFESQFHRVPDIVVEAPGRVNLVGEHTDYNDGYVLPAALNLRITLVAALRADSCIQAYSANFQQSSTIDLNHVDKDENAPWSNYLRGVVAEYQERGDRLQGMDLVVGGDVPIGSGLSSSAALEVATAETCRVLLDLKIDPVQMALLCQRAEHNFIGVQCGIMDQFVSTLAQKDSALFIDCRDLSHQAVPLAFDARIVVCDSRVQRALGSSEYNTRRRECEAAVRILNARLGGIEALRDVSSGQLEEHREALTDALYRRARHVITENARVLQGVHALRQGDIQRFGELLDQSHESLRDDYQVSCRELDLLVDLARRQEGTLGARMTGAGFGGCTVNLVRTPSVESFSEGVKHGYEASTGKTPAVYVCTPSQGVSHRRP